MAIIELTPVSIQSAITTPFRVLALFVLAVLAVIIVITAS